MNQETIWLIEFSIGLLAIPITLYVIGILIVAFIESK